MKKYKRTALLQALRDSMFREEVLKRQVHRSAFPSKYPDMATYLNRLADIGVSVADVHAFPDRLGFTYKELPGLVVFSHPKLEFHVDETTFVRTPETEKKFEDLKSYLLECRARAEEYYREKK